MTKITQITIYDDNTVDIEKNGAIYEATLTFHDDNGVSDKYTFANMIKTNRLKVTVVDNEQYDEH